MRVRPRRVPWLLPCAGLVLLGSSLAALPVPAISAIVAQIAATNTTPAVDSYGDYLARLRTGEGNRRGYATDRSPQPDLVEARRFIRSSFEELVGTAAVAEQVFAADGYVGANYVATLQGEGPSPRAVYVIGAHYDSEQNPGADDDASGVAGLLEAVRVLRGSRFTGTIVFVAFDQEEERRSGWGLGSQFYATQARQAGTNVQAMIGFDMIAYNHAGGNRATLSRCDRARTGASVDLLSRVQAAFQDYSGLSVATLTGEDASDPYRFYQAGIPALLVSEEFGPDGWPLNPHYHRATDFFLERNGQPLYYAGYPYIDLPYAARIVGGAVGWVATAAGYLGPRGAPPAVSHR